MQNNDLLHRAILVVLICGFATGGRPVNASGLRRWGISTRLAGKTLFSGEQGGRFRH
jgi:hypothetical protein